MELIYILLFGIVVAAIQGLFGIVPASEPEQENDKGGALDLFFDEMEKNNERYNEEVAHERFGTCDYGHGHYNKNYPYDK